MNIDTVAAQLRTIATVFNGNVAGAAAYANGVADQVWLPLPAAYVVPLDQDAEDNTSMQALNQIVRERVGVIVVMDTMNAGGAPDTGDRRGQAAAANLDTLKYAVFKAILNWRPDGDPPSATNRESRGMYFVGAGFPEPGAFDRARFFYQFVFGLDTTITDADGWQQPFDMLIDINSTVISGDPNIMLDVSIDVPITPGQFQVDVPGLDTLDVNVLGP